MRPNSNAPPTIETTPPSPLLQLLLYEGLKQIIGEADAQKFLQYKQHTHGKDTSVRKQEGHKRSIGTLHKQDV